jgi:hypothetical protein
MNDYHVYYEEAAENVIPNGSEASARLSKSVEYSPKLLPGLADASLPVCTTSLLFLRNPH